MGSSRNSTSGRPASAQATDSRCFCPPDSLTTQASRFDSSSTMARSSSTVGPSRIERAEQPQRFGHGQLVGELRFLQLNAEPRAQPCRSRLPAAARAPRPRRRRPASRPSRISIDVVLPAPFGPEQAEALARVDVEIETVDGRDVAIALDEPAATQGWLRMCHRAILCLAPSDIAWAHLQPLH